MEINFESNLEQALSKMKRENFKNLTVATIFQPFFIGLFSVI